MSLKLEKSQTGIAGEYYAAGELSRLGYNVTITFGNTKSVDLLIQKDTSTYAVQVKSIQSTSSICWTVDKTKVKAGLYYILINLHVDQPESKPDFFVLTGAEVIDLFLDTKKAGQKRTYLDYKRLKRMGGYQNRWGIFGRPEEVIEGTEVYTEVTEII
jgi:hypothetical protein